MEFLFIVMVAYLVFLMRAAWPKLFSTIKTTRSISSDSDESNGFSTGASEYGSPDSHKHF